MQNDEDINAKFDELSSELDQRAALADVQIMNFELHMKGKVHGWVHLTSPRIDGLTLGFHKDKVYLLTDIGSTTPLLGAAPHRRILAVKQLRYLAEKIVEALQKQIELANG